MRLSQENIDFIDDYLKRNDVMYFDIRMEMLDHILNGIENEMTEKSIGFYDAFKNYMPKNKKEVFKMNEKSSFEALKLFSKSLLNRYSIIVALFTAIICFVFKNSLIVLNSIFWILMLLYLLFITIIYFLTSRKRYYILEKMGLIMNVIYFINLFINGFVFAEFQGNIYTISIVLFLSTSFYVYYIKTVVKFNKSQKHLFIK